MVVFDATLLMYLFRPEIDPPTDVSTGLIIDRWRDRLNLLVATLEKERTKVIVPSPALAELLVRAGAEKAQRIVEEINKSSVLKIESFDALAAIEVATMTRAAIANGSKSDGLSATWAKIKYDRQIVAIGKVHQATVIYSDDADIKSHAEKVGIKVLGVVDLPAPPEKAQFEMFKEATPDEAEIAEAEIAAQNAGESPPGL